MSLRNLLARMKLQGAARPIMFATVLSMAMAMSGTASHAQAEPPVSPAPAAADLPANAANDVPAVNAAETPTETVAEPKTEAGAAAPTPALPSFAPPAAVSVAPASENAAEDAASLANSGLSPARTIDAAQLPRDLSPWSMFLEADVVVKAVMIGLAFASVVTWTVWLAKSVELMRAKFKLGKAYSQIYGASSLAEACQRVGNGRGIVPGLIELAALELRLSADAPDKAGIKERVLSRLEGLAATAGRDMNRGTGVLATIGATAPFVGLFGTVWGIMNSFIGISESQTTNLAIVAPGIAEALLATAIGLVAAIPAVIVYNQFARSIAGYKAAIAEAVAEIMRLVSRDLDRGLKAGPIKAAV